jgi:hypothetical protein
MANKPPYKKPSATKAPAVGAPPKQRYVKKHTVYWCKYQQPDNNNKFTVDAVNLTADEVKFYSDLGIEIRNKDDERGSFVQFMAFGQTPKGDPVDFTNNVVDASLKKFTGGNIGNGSVVNIDFVAEPWEYMGKSGVRLRMFGIQVLQHVPYGGSNFKVEEEYIEASDESSPFAVAS